MTEGAGRHLAVSIRKHAAERPDALAITSGQTTLTYREFDAVTNRVATALAVFVPSGGRVGALVRMHAEGVETFIACAKAGFVFVPISWRLTPDDIAAIVADADLDALLLDPEFGEIAAPTRARLPELPVIVTGESWESFVESGSDNDPGLGDDPEAAVLQLYTSGTTGLPKGVVSTNRNLRSDPEGLRTYRLTPESVALDPMPLFHIAGAGFLNSCLAAGSHAVLMGDFDARVAAEIIQRHHVTHAFLVPSTIQMVLELPDLADFDLSSLQSVAYGGSPITPTLLRRAIATLRCGFVQRYGMTETTGTVCALLAEDHDPDGPRAHLLTSAGTALPGVTLAIRDIDTGAHLPVGETGEIVCRARTNTAGYWKRPVESAAMFTDDGFVRTGDAGYLDENGYLFVTDRVKDMIITGGENVYPAEIESVLAEHPSVAEVAVIGLPDDTWGEAITAVVRVLPGSAEPDDLIEFAAARVASYKKPKRIHFVSELPRNAGGKVLKRTLREQLVAQQLSSEIAQ